MLSQVEMFSPADAAESELVECYEIARAAYVTDYPDKDFQPYSSFADQMHRTTWLLGLQRIWVARMGHRIVGIVTVFFPERENRQMAITKVVVPPALRRRGIGTALLGATLSNARSEGRTTITGQGLKVCGDGDRWASSLGFRRVQEFVMQALNVPDTDSELWDVPPPPGFRSERWTDSAPDRLVSGYAQARTAITDAPKDISSLRFPEWTVERVRQHEADLRKNDFESRVVVAIHESSGVVAGLTELLVRASRPELAYQQDTAVLPAFRGHGLGRFMKAAMMRWLVTDRPEIQRVATNTDAGNVHMIRVNHQVGYLTDYTLADVEAERNVLDALLTAC